jgi:DNA-binding transcriptional MerR regulator
MIQRMGTETFSLKELEALSGVSERTIRWYISEGILPRADSRGRDARYSRLHLERLLAARHLRDHEGLSISEIRNRIQSAGPEELRYLSAQASSEQPRAGVSPETTERSAHELVSGWQAEDAQPHYRLQSSVRSSLMAEISPLGRRAPRFPSQTPLDRLVHELGRMVQASQRRVPRQARAEEWHHIPITPEIEFAVKGSLGEDQIRRLERVADYLKEVLTGGFEPTHEP